MSRTLFALTLLVTVCSCGVAPEEVAISPPQALYVDQHFPGGHGPFAASGPTPTWGEVEVCCTPANYGERWLGDVGSYYEARPTPGVTWITKSANYTYAVAYEFVVAPGSYAGRTWSVTTSWKLLDWSPQAIVIWYDDPCPTASPAQWTIAHPCTSDWTPIDSGGAATYVVGNGIAHNCPGPLCLPYGDYLKDTSGTGAGTWCTFNFSDLPNVTKPPGAANHAVAVDACP